MGIERKHMKQYKEQHRKQGNKRHCKQGLQRRDRDVWSSARVEIRESRDQEVFICFQEKLINYTVKEPKNAE